MACVARHSLVFSNRCSLIISHAAPLVGRDLDLNSKTLQVEGFDNVFVGGDMASGNHTSFAGHEGERTAQSAIYHGSVISRNIIRMAGGDRSFEACAVGHKQSRASGDGAGQPGEDKNPLVFG